MEVTVDLKSNDLLYVIGLAAFLGFWGLMLFLDSRRLRRLAKLKAPKPEEPKGISGLYNKQEIDTAKLAFPDATDLHEQMLAGLDIPLGTVALLYDEVVEEIDPKQIIDLIYEGRDFEACELLKRLDAARRVYAMFEEQQELDESLSDCGYNIAVAAR